MKAFGIVVTLLSVLVCSTSYGQDFSNGLTTGTRDTGVTIVAKFADQPTHIARTSGDKLFATLFSLETDKSRLIQITPEGESVDYPNTAWNTGRQPDGTGFIEIVGLKGAENGWLAVIDAGNATNAPRVLIFDTKNNAIIKNMEIASFRRPVGVERFKQDLAIDIPNRCIYALGISNDKKSATLVVIDLKTDAIRDYTLWQGDKPGEIVAGETTQSDGESARRGLSVPIAIDPSSQWVYLAGIGGESIYRIKAAALADPQLTSMLLDARLEKYGTKKICTHIAADDAGTVYCTEQGSGVIGMYTPERQYRIFSKDKILTYPYGIAIGRDGNIYVSVNQISRLQEGKTRTVDRDLPFIIARIKAHGSLP